MPVWETILQKRRIGYTYLLLSSGTLYFCKLPDGLTFNMIIDSARKSVHLCKLFYPELLTGSPRTEKNIPFGRPSPEAASNTSAEVEYCADRSINFFRPEAAAQLELFLASFIETIREMIASELLTIHPSYCEVSLHDPNDSSFS